jgi:hypothetical protein
MQLVGVFIDVDRVVLGRYPHQAWPDTLPIRDSDRNAMGVKREDAP